MLFNILIYKKSNKMKKIIDYENTKQLNYNTTKIQSIQSKICTDQKNTNQEFQQEFQQEFVQEDLPLFQMLMSLNPVCRIYSKDLFSDCQIRRIDMLIPDTKQYIPVRVCNACGLVYKKRYVNYYGSLKILSKRNKLGIPRCKLYQKKSKN